MQLVIICNRSNRKRPFRSEVPSILAIDEIRRSWVQEPSAKAKFPVMLSGWPIALDGWVCGRRADQLDIIVMIEVGVYCRQIGAAIMSKAGDDTDLNGEQGCPFFPLEHVVFCRNRDSHSREFLIQAPCWGTGASMDDATLFGRHSRTRSGAG